MKKLNMMFALVALMLLAAGCGKEVNVAFTTSELTVVADGGEVTANLTSNGDWTVDAHPEWISVSPSSGSGDTQLVLLVLANNGDEARSGEISVSSKKNTAKLTVVQEARTAFLRVLPDHFSCDRWGDTCQIQVESNLDWELTGLPDWIVASATEGSNNGQIVLTIAPIEDEVSEGRQAVLTIAGGGYEAQVTVNQSHESGLVFDVSPTDLEFSYFGGTETLSVTSTVPWTASTEADWITFGSNSGYGDAEITVNVAENTEFVSRKESIRFDYSFPGGSTGSVFVWVYQGPAPDPHFLTVSPQELSFDKNGGTAEITVECDVDWNAEVLSDWAFLSVTSGMGNATVTLTVSPNTVTEPRSLAVQFTSGLLNQKVVVSQEEGDEPPMLTMSPDTVFVSSMGAVETLTINSNISWELEANVSWIMLLSPAGNGNGTKDIIVDSNVSNETRYGQVCAWHDGHLMDMTVVVQEGKHYLLETDITEIVAGPEGGQFTINLTSTLDWHLSKGAEWLSYAPNSGSGNAQIVVTVDPLISQRPRTAEIYIIGDFDQMVIITVSQSND